MRAIILAAGLGLRLQQQPGKQFPKCLLSFDGLTLLERHLRLLDAAGVQSGAGAVLFTSFDGAYTESLTMDQARRPDMLVATTLYNAPLTNEHGAPVRLYAAPMYGYKSIKWLGGIQVAKTVKPGYWENLGYDVDAWVGQSNGRSDAPIA